MAEDTKPAGDGTTPTGGKDGKEGTPPPPAGAGAGEGKESAGAGAGSVAAGDVKHAPDSYKLTVPEGARLTASEIAQIEKYGREQDLTNEDLQAELDGRLAVLNAQALMWENETKADPELGGDKLETTQQLTIAAIDGLFPKGDKHREGFLDFLNRGGIGNNIHMVRALARIGKGQKEDGPVGGRGGGSGNAGKAPEDILYGPPSS